MTCFHARAGHDRFDELLDVLLDMLLDSKFAPADIAKEREVIKEEIAMYLDEPQHHVQELLNATLWPDQPLGRPITGTEQTLDAMTRGHLLGYLRENYVAGNVLIVAAGRLKHRQVVRAVARYAPALPRAPPARASPRRAATSRSRGFGSSPRRPSKRKSRWASAPARGRTSAATPCACSTPSWART